MPTSGECCRSISQCARRLFSVFVCVLLQRSIAGVCTLPEKILRIDRTGAAMVYGGSTDALTDDRRSIAESVMRELYYRGRPPPPPVCFVFSSVFVVGVIRTVRVGRNCRSRNLNPLRRLLLGMRSGVYSRVGTTDSGQYSRLSNLYSTHGRRKQTWPRMHGLHRITVSDARSHGAQQPPADVPACWN
jgi:hypothetical protein